MSDAAIIKADFVDTKRVKTRKVLQLVFECPLEVEPEVMRRLGWPNPSETLPVAIARLTTTGPDTASVNETAQPTGVWTPDDAAQGQGKPRHSFRELKKSAQVALKCQEKDFYQWLTRHPQFNPISRNLSGAMTDEQIADEVVKRILGVSSKRELDSDPDKGAAWDGMLTSYEVRNYRT